MLFPEIFVLLDSIEAKRKYANPQRTIKTLLECGFSGEDIRTLFTIVEYQRLVPLLHAIIEDLNTIQSNPYNVLRSRFARGELTSRKSSIGEFRITFPSYKLTDKVENLDEAVCFIINWLENHPHLETYNPSRGKGAI